MACYHPIPAVRTPAGMTLRPKPPQTPTHFLKCGKCLGCRDAHATMWALRLRHEMRYHSRNIFLTFTYDDENCPDGLEKAHLKQFWKRLRYYADNRLKYYACGEYGERTKRPHYHAATFGMPEITDAKLWDSINHHSEHISNLWGYGRVLMSTLTPGRIRYVTGYVLKKAGYRKQVYCDPDGVLLQSPFQMMSKGLGAQFVGQFPEALQHGFARLPDDPDTKQSIPRYYREILKWYKPQLEKDITTRIDAKRATLPDPDPARNKAAEIIREQRVKEHRSRKAL